LRQHKLFYQSSYDRGLEHLLKMWPSIKLAIPDATLDICYGWDLFDKMNHNNPERVEWKRQMVELMQQIDVTEHGRIGKKEMAKLRSTCGILAYPAHFTEISCISVMEAMRDGLVPVTTDLAALKETNDCGVMVSGDIYDPTVKQSYLEALLNTMGDETLFKEKQQKCLQKAKKLTWEKVADKWINLFDYKEPQPLISIITPTVRQGWWNLMAHNLASQTYKNFEWIIVDDYKENRSQVALEYAQKYGLNIRYVRGKKRAVKRSYGLVNANNTGLQEAKGELLVILQDFIVIPERGIELLADVYRRNPNALIAPTDHMYASRIKPRVDSEDWFGGETDVKGKLLWKNVRNTGQGMRTSDNPYEFEQNYCGIPAHIAKELNGWWEYYDSGLGFDNTDFCRRALAKGYKLIVDDTNVCYGIDHWKPTEDRDKHLYIARHRRLSDPIYYWSQVMTKANKLPLVRDQKIDDQIDLQYTLPDEVKDKDVVKYLRDNLQEIIEPWFEKYSEGFK